MSNLEITNNDLSVVQGEGAKYQDELLTFAGAVTVLAGTILARDSVSLKMVPFVKGGSTNENGIPKAVLTHAITSTGAGDLAVRPLVEGNVYDPLLVIDADGDASNIDNTVRDELRDYGILPVALRELNELDNQ